MIESARRQSRREFLQASAAGAALGVSYGAGDSGAVPETAALLERLGYSVQSKLLVLHADDLGVAHAGNRASFAALEDRAVSSASAIVPAPWLTEVADYFKLHPEIDLGIHFALTSEWETYRWGPVAPGNQVRSLVDQDGYLWRSNRLFFKHATPDEVEIELRAQINRAMCMGIRPTHFDSHMLTLLLAPKFYGVLVKLGHEYRLPFRASRNMEPRLLKLLSSDDLVLDPLPSGIHSKTAPGQPVEAKTHIAEVLHNLRPGLYEIIVHLAFDNSETRAIFTGHPGTAERRQQEFKDISSPECKQALLVNHVTLVNWKELYHRFRASSGLKGDTPLAVGTQAAALLPRFEDI